MYSASLLAMSIYHVSFTPVCRLPLWGHTCISSHAAHFYTKAGPPYPDPKVNASGYLYENNGNEEIMWQMSPRQIPIKVRGCK
jgi:hypothetical protein